ncbi:MAG: biotin transporter BioY [Candidatus Krumholzibacteria bacterium]|nr:biotin transporter BioY [Candidatus Krumholzibacteria bacterium]
MAHLRKGAGVQSKVLAITGMESLTAGSCSALVRVSKIVAFACFTTIAAQLSVPLPFTPVPLTMQTLFVVMAGLTLGARDGFYAMLAYVSLGFAGAPVFAELSGGPHVLLGPTGGYLAAFPAAALVAGWISEKLGGNRFAAFAASLCGMALILAAGASYLSIIAGISFARAASLGILPFAAGELVKALIASIPPAGRAAFRAIPRS